jgi:putative ABC transport system permease protein
VGASLLLVSHDPHITGQFPRVVTLAELNRASTAPAPAVGNVMNLFQLVLKQMRQRSLSTWLTMLSVVLGVALAVAVMIVQREGYALFGQTEYGYQVLVGPKGSPLQLTLNTVYQLDRSPGNIPYALYEELATSPQYRPQVKAAIPYAVGDTYKGLRIVGTLPELFGPDAIMEYRPGRKYDVAQGRVFAPKKVRSGDRLGGHETDRPEAGRKFKATHGMPARTRSPTSTTSSGKSSACSLRRHTAADKNLFIPLTSFYTIAEHEEALAAHAAIRAGEDPNKAVASAPATATTEAITRRALHRSPRRHDRAARAEERVGSAPRS